MAAEREHAAYCQSLVRQADRDRYLATLFAPATARPHLFALYAFNVEVSSVRDRVSDPMPGEIRLQWWRDVLAGERDAEAAIHPVAAPLISAIERFSLSRAAFFNLVDARVFDLYDDPMPTMTDAEGYAGDTSSALLQIAAIILAGGEDPKTADAAGHGGVAYALTGQLRALPLHASRRQLYLAEDILGRHNVDPNRIFAGERSPELDDALAEIRFAARRHLAAARNALGEADKRALPAFLPLRLVEPYLAAMERPEFDPFRSFAEITPWRRLWSLWRASHRMAAGNFF